LSDPSGTAGETRVLTTEDPASQRQVLERGSNGGFVLREFTSAEVEEGRSETRRANAAKAKQIEKSLQRPSERYLDNAQRDARIRGRVRGGLPLHPAVGDGKSRGRAENTDADGNYSAYMQGVIASEAANGPHPRMSPGAAGHLTEGIVQDGGEVGDKVAGAFFGAAMMKGAFLRKSRPKPVSAAGEIKVAPRTPGDFSGDAAAAVAKNKPKVRVGPAVEASAAGGRVAPLAKVFEGHGPGQGFTSVFDTATGQVKLIPSTTQVPTPAGFVPRRGGHAPASRALGGERANHAGFAVILEEGGGLRITWRSGQLNKTPDALVPEGLRPAIVEAVEQQTGRRVTFF